MFLYETVLILAESQRTAPLTVRVKVRPEEYSDLNVCTVEILEDVVEADFDYLAGELIVVSRSRLIIRPTV